MVVWKFYRRIYGGVVDAFFRPEVSAAVMTPATASDEGAVQIGIGVYDERMEPTTMRTLELRRPSRTRLPLRLCHAGGSGNVPTAAAWGYRRCTRATIQSSQSFGTRPKLEAFREQ